MMRVMLLMLMGLTLACQPKPVVFMKHLVKDVQSEVASHNNAYDAVPAIRRKLLSVADRSYVVARVLGSTYRALSTEERQRLEDLLASHIMSGYVDAFKQVESDQHMHFFPARGKHGKDHSTVKAKFRTRSGRELHLQFPLVCKNEHWLVQDVMVDGISVVDGYVSQLRPVVEQQGIDGLVEKIK